MSSDCDLYHVPSFKKLKAEPFISVLLHLLLFAFGGWYKLKAYCNFYLVWLFRHGSLVVTLSDNQCSSAKDSSRIERIRQLEWRQGWKGKKRRMALPLRLESHLSPRWKGENSLRMSGTPIFNSSFDHSGKRCHFVEGSHRAQNVLLEAWEAPKSLQWETAIMNHVSKGNTHEANFK